MDKFNRRDLKIQAKEALSRSQSRPLRLVGIHAGVTVAALLLLTALNALLQGQIAGTGGLSGMGYRSILSSVQALIQPLVSILLAFWNIGYLFVAWKLARGEDAAPRDLLQGIRRVGPAARFLVIKALIFLALGMICFYPSMSLYLMTPLARPLMEALEPLAAQSAVAGSVEITDAMAEAVSQAMVPMLGIFLIIYLAVCTPFFYRFRLAEFALWEDPQAGALSALRRSSRITRGSRMDLLKLDLSFWWYYLALALLTALSYGDLLLPLLGIQLPVSQDAAFYLFYGLSLVGQGVLILVAKNYVTVTLARAYETLRHPPEQTPRQMPPVNVPWTY